MRYTGLHVRRPSGYGRRVMALNIGIAGLGLALMAPSSRANAAASASQQDDFGRMFNLPPFAEPTPQVQAALAELGRRGGFMDAKDNLAAGPIALIVDPALSQQPRQPSAHCRCDVPRAVPRSRHDVRHDVEARAPDEPAHGAQRAAAVLRSRFGLRRWTVRIAASIRTAGPRQAPRGIRRTLRRSSP